MCGIVGYVGEKRCSPILLHGLAHLEYRGYDSAGIAVLENNTIILKKEQGRVKNLEASVSHSFLSGTVGIAHTRWATHGKPSSKNAHPHVDNSSTFAVVHNGIIENHKELRSLLKEHHYSFYSQTDTEVIPNLIHYYYEKEEKSIPSFLKAVSLACQKLKGSYALLVLCKDFPDLEIVTKKESPLVIGKGDKESYIASDIPAILEYTKDFYFLEDNEIGLVEKNKITFFDGSLVEHKKEVKHIAFNSSASSKNGYEDFMLKEIEEQPEALRKTIKSRVSLGKFCDFSDIPFSQEELASVHQIYIIACGTAMHAGLVGKHMLEQLCQIPTYVEIASEFRYGSALVDSNTLCIFISQSGETADTIAALKLAKQKGAKTLAITNVMSSSITREAEYSLYTYAGPEIAVASTKAYTCQVALIGCFTLFLAETLKKVEEIEIEKLKKELLDLPEKVEEILQKEEDLQKIAKDFYLQKNLFFLGRGIDYCVSLEGSLKLKEISYIHSEAYPAGELKHGPIALIEQGTVVVGILTDSHILAKTISNLQEVMTRGASVLIISTTDTLLTDVFDYVFTIPKTSTFLSPILSVVPLQLLAYFIAKYKNLDVDKPRNLAKSVTVE